MGVVGMEVEEDYCIIFLNGGYWIFIFVGVDDWFQEFICFIRFVVVLDGGQGILCSFFFCIDECIIGYLGMFLMFVLVYSIILFDYRSQLYWFVFYVVQDFFQEVFFIFGVCILFIGEGVDVDFF